MTQHPQLQSTEKKCSSPQIFQGLKTTGNNSSKLKLLVLHWTLTNPRFDIISKHRIQRWLIPNLQDARTYGLTLTQADSHKLLTLTYPYFKEQTYPELLFAELCTTIRSRLTSDEAQDFIHLLERLSNEFK